MNYKLDLGAWGSVFAVPSSVVDSLKIASGNHLKVLLYILRKPDYIHPTENIAKDIGISESEVDEAVIFWKNLGILAESGGVLAPPEAPASSGATPAPRAASDNSAAVKAALRSEIQFPPKEIASAVNNDNAVKYLFDTFERLAGRPTKHAERNALMTMIEDVGLPCEVAVMLVEYCFSIEKATPAYMRAVAEDWWNSGVDTISRAETRIKEIKRSNELESRLHRKFGLSSAFSQKQKKEIAEWAAFDLPDELYDEAYDITMRNTGKFSFPYFSKIIRGWGAEGVRALSDIRRKPAAEENTSSFDLGEIAEWSVRKYSDLHKKGDDSE